MYEKPDVYDGVLLRMLIKPRVLGGGQPFRCRGVVKNEPEWGPDWVQIMDLSCLRILSL